MSESIDRRAFCIAAGCGALALAGCGADGGYRPPHDGATDGELPGDDLAQLEQPDMTMGGGSPDLTMGGLCSGKVTGPLASSLMVNQAIKTTGAGVFVCRDAGGIYALTNVCTHSGCAVTFRSANPDFYCACHVSIFDFNGARTLGPAKAPLVHFACCIDGSGKVIVDTNKTVAAGVRI